MTASLSAFHRAAQQRPAPPPVAVPQAARAAVVGDRVYRLPLGLLIWVLVVLMIVPEGFDYQSLHDAEAPAAGGAISRLLWLMLLGSGVGLMLWRSRLTTQLISKWINPFLLLFVVLGLASIAWSIDSGLTTRRMIRVFAIVAVGFAMVLAGWHAHRFQSVLRPILTLMLAGSIVFGLTMPDLAIHLEEEGVLLRAWHGLANHKNSLGNLACIGLIFWLHAALSKQAGWIPALLGAAVALTCLVLARSSTSMVTAVFSLLLMLFLMRSPRALQRYMPTLITVFAASLLVYTLALLEVIPGFSKLLAPISMITGKDMTFTGRTDIWQIIYDEIALHPWLGTGYGAYWAGPVAGTASYEMVRLLHFYPGSAHNGYLEVLNGLGAVGLMILLAFLALFLRQALRLLAVDRYQAALYLTLFLQQAISNLSESRWLSVQSVDFVIMTLATMGLARALMLHRLALSPQPGRQRADRLMPVLGPPRQPAFMGAAP